MPNQKTELQLRRYSTMIKELCFLLLFLLAFIQCAEKEIRLDLEENGGLFLADGFEAVAVVNRLQGKARHLAVAENGDIYVKLRHPDKKGGNAALRDTDGDGRADVIKKFGDYEVHGSYGTGMRIHKGYLYYSSQTTVYRQKLSPGELVPQSEIKAIVIDDHEKTRREHIGKPFAFDEQGHIYVPFGAPSNACQDPKRTPGAPGQDPCPQLETYGGVWRFAADKPNQIQKDGYKFSTGIRSVVGMDWNPLDKNVYLLMHGRDDLLRLFSNHFTPWESALLPSEEFLKVTEGSDFGWPYCFYDQLKEKKVLAPEYGGDGDSIGRCAQYDLPIMGFPGHWAPNDLVFYHGAQFPERYRNGAFIAFHGSTNRAPYPQSGYIIGFVPFENGKPTGAWEVFADGFARVDTIVNVSDAVFRPMGIAVGPDGSLYIAETEHGAIWRIQYKGNKRNFGPAQLAKMEARKNKIHIRTPDIVMDNLQKDAENNGEFTYMTYCGTCHQENGKGDGARFPPLVDTDWVSGDKERLIGVVLNGLEGSIEVNGQAYDNLMPQHSFLTDEQIAAVLSFIREEFGGGATAVEAEEVRMVRGEGEL